MLGVPRRRHKRSIVHRASSCRPEIESMETRCLMAVITVTSTGDAINATDGVVTLREAITAADSNKNISDVVGVGAYGTDTIAFDIPGPGVHTIRPTSATAGDHRPGDDRRLHPAGVRPQYQSGRPGAQRQASHRDRRRERRECPIRDDRDPDGRQHGARPGHQPHARGGDWLQ